MSIPLQEYLAIAALGDEPGQAAFFSMPLTQPASGPLEPPPAGSNAVLLFSSTQLCAEYIESRSLGAEWQSFPMTVTSCVDFLLEANRRKIHTHVCFNPSRNIPAALPIEAFVLTMPERTAENPGHM